MRRVIPMNRFKQTICDWSSWGKVFQSTEAFRPLIEYILEKEELPAAGITNCTPGTNAVFRVGNHIVKIFAPEESGMDTDSDYKTELFGLNRAARLGIPVPKLMANGYVADKYIFKYMIMEHIDGGNIGDIEDGLTYDEKFAVGRILRNITDKMNTPCERFNDADIIKSGIRNKRWNIMSDRFNRRRLEYLKKYKPDTTVFVHGDLNPDNIMLGRDGEIYILDFADALTAPPEYELPALICELFCFEEPYMRGYFGDYDIDELTDKCFSGLLMHDFGADIIKCNLGDISGINDLNELKTRLRTAIKEGKQIEY